MINMKNIIVECIELILWYHIPKTSYNLNIGTIIDNASSKEQLNKVKLETRIVKIAR